MSNSNETDKLDVTSILRGETFQHYDPYIRVWSDNEYYYLQTYPDGKPIQFISFNKLLMNPHIKPEMMGRRQARLWRRNQPKKKILNATSTEVPASGFKLPPNCVILTVEVPLYPYCGRKPKRRPEKFTYKLLDGNIVGDMEANLIVAYSDGTFFYVAVYQHGRRLFSTTHEYMAAAINQFNQLQQYMTFELLDIRRKYPQTRPGDTTIRYYSVRWATGEHQSLLAKPKDNLKEKGNRYVRPPMNDSEWLNS